jgi:hypothetical protein
MKDLSSSTPRIGLAEHFGILVQVNTLIVGY